jgi:hypothetical protein
MMSLASTYAYASCFATNVTLRPFRAPSSPSSTNFPLPNIVTSTFQTSHFPEQATSLKGVDCSTKLDFNLFCKTCSSALTVLASRHGSHAALGVLVVPARLFWESN